MERHEPIFQQLLSISMRPTVDIGRFREQPATTHLRSIARCKGKTQEKNGTETVMAFVQGIIVYKDSDRRDDERDWPILPAIRVFHRGL
jgi:hypothetical protein